MLLPGHPMRPSKNLAPRVAAILLTSACLQAPLFGLLPPGQAAADVVPPCDGAVLDFYGAALDTEPKSCSLQIDLSGASSARLRYKARDLDAPYEAKVDVNRIPTRTEGFEAGYTGNDLEAIIEVPLPLEKLVSGWNTVSFIFHDNVGGTTGGFVVSDIDVEVESAPAGAPQVATPEITPPSGSYKASVNVEIATSTPGATIHYTIDASDPTIDSPVYDRVISIAETTEVRALAVRPDYRRSDIARATFSISKPVLASTWAPERLNRGLVALPLASGSVFLSWRLLDTDNPDTSFDVYRQAADGSDLVGPLNAEPITSSTSFIDSTTALETSYRYYVNTAGGIVSNLAEATPRGVSEPWKFFKNEAGGVILRAVFGDLTGDGMLDMVVLESRPPDMYLQAYDGATTKLLWRRRLSTPPDYAGGAENAWWAPMALWDMNNDGRAEVYAFSGNGEGGYATDLIRDELLAFNGAGDVIGRASWPVRNSVPDYDTNFLAVAFWDGRPHLVAARGTQYDGVRLVAYDGDLKREWEWYAVQPDVAAASVGHYLSILDIDGDQRDEILWGSNLFGADGRLRWTRALGPRWHVDISYMGDFDPSRPGFEIYYADCGTAYASGKDEAAVYLVDAATGLGPAAGELGIPKRVLWARTDDPVRKRPLGHLHGGYVADIDPTPGFEVVTWDDYDSLPPTYPLWEHPTTGLKTPYLVLDVKGNVIFHDTDFMLAQFAPVQLDDDDLWEVSHCVGDPFDSTHAGCRVEVHDFDKGPTTKPMDLAALPNLPNVKPQITRQGARNQFAGFQAIDVFGDFREELVTIAADDSGVYVISNTTLSQRRRVTWLQDKVYRQAVAHLGTGYVRVALPSGR
jgi:hypothetical protein